MLLFRTAAVLLIAAAIARPLLHQTKTEDVGEAAGVTRIILLDCSQSMAARDGGLHVLCVAGDAYFETLQGLTMTLTFEPLLPPIAWVTMAVLAVALWVWYAMKRPGACGRTLWLVIMGLTAVGIGTVLVVLLNPLWLEPLPPPAGKPLLTILVDRSESMATADEKGITRFSAAAKAAAELADDLSRQFDVRLQMFAEASRPVDADQLQMTVPDGAVTNLSTPLMDALVSDRPQGQAVLMLSDGVHNAPGSVGRAIEAAESARAWDTPVFTTTLGADVHVNDLEIRVPRSQELAFVGQSIPVLVELQQHGAVGYRVDVTLTGPDGTETTQQAPILPNGTTDTSFMIESPETGLFQYQVRATALPGEATPANNATTFQVRVVDKPVKALVLEGKPYWDAKFLLRMLTDDPSLEVDCIVRVASERYLWRKLMLVDSVGDARLPREGEDVRRTGEGADRGVSNDGTESRDSRLRFQRREEMEFMDNAQSVLQDRDRLSEYQILLLGREAESYLSDMAVENIRAWIAQDGGSLVCYRGSPVAEPNQKLSRLLPVRWATGRNAVGNEERFRIQITERGDDLSWLRIGGQGAESSIVSVRIISQEDFDRIQRQKEGMKTMQNRYQQAQRRLEKPADEMEKLKEQLEAAPQDSELAEELRQEMQQVAEEMQKEADAIQKLGETPLPLELDQELAPQLKEMADKLREMSEQISRTAQQPNATNQEAFEQIQKQLDAMKKEQQRHQEEAMQPLEQLAQVLPLKQAESEFTQLAMKQRELADRLQSLKGQNANSDPQIRARMRELEEEQHRNREQLNDLLDRIEEHANSLPDAPELEELRSTALEFAKAVRECEAGGEMANAEGSLTEFDGTSGHAHADKAATLLEQFLSQCNGMGEAAGNCLPKFNPGLGQCMSNTLQQLSPGMKPGTGVKQGGMGLGMAGSGGYSSQMSTMNNVGLYGGEPQFDPANSSMGESNSDNIGGVYTDPFADGQNSGGSGFEAHQTNPAYGGADWGVPIQYRRQAGQYLQRLAEDLEE
ncbi:MAG: hypothetical protein R3C59_05430 [Planctomycetaceae bacterium]